MRIAFLMDPLERVLIDKDTSFALMLEAQRRGHETLHLGLGDLHAEPERIVGTVRPATVRRVAGDHFSLGRVTEVDLSEVDAVLIRKDPPFDAAYLHATLLLEALRNRTLLVNDPRGLREANEKLCVLRWPLLTPAMLVTRERSRIWRFVDAHGGQAVVKPIDGAGGFGVFHVRRGDTNGNAIVDLMTEEDRVPVVVQQYLPEVRVGDKRVLLLDGDPIGAVLRVPRSDEARANIHVGGRIERAPVADGDRAIARAIGPWLREQGLAFVGIDVIGSWLTEVNVTSPTGVQEINRLEGWAEGKSCEARILDWIEKRAIRRATSRRSSRRRRPRPAG